MFFTEFFTRGRCPMFLTEWLQVIASCRSPPLRVTLMENMLSLHPIVKTSAFAWKIPLRTTTASVENYLSSFTFILINADTPLENNQLCFLLNFLFTFPSLENMLSLHPIVKTRAALENTSPNDLLYFSTIFPQHSIIFPQHSISQLYSSLCLPAVFALKVLVGVFSCLSSSITAPRVYLLFPTDFVFATYVQCLPRVTRAPLETSHCWLLVMFHTFLQIPRIRWGLRNFWWRGLLGCFCRLESREGVGHLDKWEGFHIENDKGRTIIIIWDRLLQNVVENSLGWRTLYPFI